MPDFVYYLILIPFAFVIIKGLYDWLLRNSIKSLARNEVITEVRGISLVDVIARHRVTKIVYRDGNLRMLCLGRDFTNYESLYMCLPSHIIRKVEAGNITLSDSQHATDKLKRILIFILNFCDVIQRKDVDGKILDYRIEFRVGSTLSSDAEFNVLGELDSQYKIEFDKLISDIARYYSLLWEYNSIKLTYRDSYLRQVKEDWQPLKGKLPSIWLYEKYTREWYRAKENKSLYDLRD